jgi:hypothetical protein
VPWKKVNRFQPQGPSHVTIEATVATLRGSFAIPDPELLIEIGSTLVSIDRRQILDTNRVGRTAIPQHIKAEVWAREWRCLSPVRPAPTTDPCALEVSDLGIQT